MPFRGVSMEEQRELFVGLATAEGANVRGLCRRFGISPTTAYKWLKRSAASGAAGLRDGSRRPRHSPCATAGAVVQQVLLVRRAHPAWGGRKIRFHLEQRGAAGAGVLVQDAQVRLAGGKRPAAQRLHRPFAAQRVLLVVLARRA